MPVRWEKTWTPIHAGHYPRMVQLRDGTLLVTFDHKSGGQSVIGLLRSVDGGTTWGGYTPVAAGPVTDDVANAFPYELSDGTCIIALRHHTPQQKVYRLELYASGDAGMTWDHRSTIAVGTVGLWEPFLLELPDGTLQVYYASEEGIFPDQRIEMRASGDGGRTWGQPVIVARQSSSRDGMPGVVRLPGGTLLAVFEASDTPPFLFVIRAVRSDDDGKTWSAGRQLLYRPNHPVSARWSAGAPSIVQLRPGELVVSLQTDEDVAYLRGQPHADPDHPDYNYLRHTRMKCISSGDAGRTWHGALALTDASVTPALWSALQVADSGSVYALAGFRGQLWVRRGQVKQGAQNESRGR